MRRAIRATALAAAIVILPAAAAAQQPTAEAMARGARLYGQVCARCHNPRPANERSDREWATIIQHMRARANLRKSEAEALLVFLQSTNRDGRQAANEDANPSLFAAIDRYLPRVRATARKP